ncbi:hypothetical protein ZIOFF_070316 [Zingiber officinale]|uniref:GTP cyclohydrolase 1 n=1 Tax=Zingiber officinale TaxID=94328 RepID=A0A8J5ESD7_ZINOF|nr:hypothetical protein ZIOFF_070316 [Zingiber officinale]
MDAKCALSIEETVKALLQGLGENHEREGLRRTPHRVAEAFRRGTKGYKQKAKDIVQGALFPEAGLNPGVSHARGVGGLVVVHDINLFSYCESCLLPFSIKCHVGYVPSGGRVVGLSKLSRVADVFARRFQDPLQGDLWGPLALYHACIPLFQAKLGNDENVLEENDIVKIDMGCHIDGFITVVAHTHVIQEGPVTGRAADVIAAANTAVEVALCLVRPGKKKDLVTPDSSSPSSGTCSSGPPPSAKDATCYMSSTQSSPVDQDDKDGSGPEGHVTEPAMETI